jgi:hypothetical protein
VFRGSRDLSSIVEIRPVRVEPVRVIAACEHAVEVHVAAYIAETAV